MKKKFTLLAFCLFTCGVSFGGTPVIDGTFGGHLVVLAMDWLAGQMQMPEKFMSLLTTPMYTLVPSAGLMTGCNSFL
jgi:hypothetical protein